MTTLRAALLNPESPEQTSYVADGFVRLDQGRIAETGPYDGRAVDEDLRPGVLLPGFVDAHVHYPQTRIVGSASGPLLTWLERTTFPEEARFSNPDHAADVADLFCRRLAAAGTTLALAYGPVFPDATDTLFQAADRRGLKLIAGPVLMDEHCPPALRLPADRALPALEALARRWHGHDGRLEVAVIPRFALSCSIALMTGAGELARTLGLRTTTHLSETTEECRVAVDRFGAADYLEVYERCGLVGLGSVFAHCIYLTDSEWERLADAGAVIAHCPDSNAFLGSGGMPIAEVLDRDLPVAIGSDVAAGRTFSIPRILSSAYDNALRTGRSVSPSRLLWWGTRGGALALGHGEAGQIRAGLDADLCLFTPPAWAESAESVLASLLFDHDAAPIARTWVRGRVVSA